MSGFALAWDNPLDDPNGATQTALGGLDIFFFVCFFLEAAVKIISLGFYSSEPSSVSSSYIEDPWNILDLFILGISAISIMATDPSLSQKVSGLRALRSAKALKALRALRLARRFEGIRIVIQTLIDSLPDVLDTVFLVFLLMFVFALFGVSFWKGQLKGCSGAVFDNVISHSGPLMELLTYPTPWAAMTAESKAFFGPNNSISNLGFSSDCSGSFGWPEEPCCPQFNSATELVTSRMICECWGGKWANLYDQSFDNVGFAVFAVFECSTFENWFVSCYARFS